jgi:hypothetical protein
MYTKLAVGFLAVFVIAAVVISLLRRTAYSTVGRLGKLMLQRDDYRIFVGVPCAAPKEWAVATRHGEDRLNVQGYGPLSISEVRAFAVAYTNGQVLDCELCGLPLPKGLQGLYPTARADSDVLHLDDLEAGKVFIQVTYGPSPTRPRERGHYSTALKNLSAERIRVRRFAGYTPRGTGWLLSTVTRQFYSADEFREWYGLGSSEWIEPGQTVTDSNNYGSPPVLWAYYCETASGERFVAGGVLE